MSEHQNILFVPHHPEQAVNALILARKLTQAASTLGYAATLAASPDAVETTDANLVIVVGQALANLKLNDQQKVAVIGLEQANDDIEQTLQQALSQAQDAKAAATSSTATRFVAITACPTGVAHTFMAAEALQQGAVKLGYQIDVETQGSVGAKNILSPEAIAAADIVILATDIEVNTDRFVGKRVYRCGTGFALKQTDKAFAAAISDAKVLDSGKQSASTETTEKKEKVGIYKHLLTGVSFMLPMVVAGGLLIALSFCFGIEAFKEAGTLAAALKQVGDAAFLLMVPMLSGYIAYSIADRPGLAPGLIGGVLASQLQAGFLGGIISGFLAGYLALFIAKKVKLPTSLEALKPILIIPLLGSLIVGLLMIYVVGQPVAHIFEIMQHFLNSMGTTNAILLGIILGGMMCVDLGGPINKAAYAFTVGLLTTHTYLPMAITMAAGMVPPIGMAIATLLAKAKFEQSERDAGKAAFVLGLCFISEGAIPFAAKDPIRVIPCTIAGGALTGALVALFQCELMAPHGGIFVLLIPGAIHPAGLYLLAIAIGSVVTGVAYAFVKQKLAQPEKVVTAS
ncbi:fructose-specific PTS transporter subunit EIIC [Acinetobacter sp. MD2(2019)]|uniref:fructose-specific PTS transporter subunit EIIC n=1 Tax=Acinetobacter sp. MD2(2019) TaxID=2605273 RepID=UPI002D1F435D|nr:fructose-specific PTS transporter subunit EIIC [Acinetobacter sp. MD2(2019)]MEB3754446.1 PTS transporter subunit EIIC [Acinetobacter sp. MD2(2019)]